MKRDDLIHWKNKKYWIEYDTTINKIIDRMINRETENELIIPEYQRDYVWNRGDDPKLLLSLYKGFPIGNIILWENGKEYFLIDGLQRYTTIFKIYKNPFNFLSFNLYKFWLEDKNEKLISFIKKEDSEKEAFRHLNSRLNHKNNYKLRTKEEIFKFLDNEKSISFINDNNIKIQRFKNFIEDFDNWYKNEFKKINIPHYVLDNMDSKEVSEVFKIINDSGKKLSRFEVASANWSKFKININEQIEYISNFNKWRIKKYKENFKKHYKKDEKEPIHSRLVKYDNKNIIPSNFLYALFYEVFKNDNELKHTFIDKRKEFTIVTKAIEPLCEVIRYILIVKFNSTKEITFNDIGKELQNKIKTKKDVDKLKNTLKNSFVKVKNKLDIIKTTRINGQNKFPSYPIWLLSTFAIYIINNYNDLYFNKWFIKELLFDKRLSSATGTKAREIIKNREFEKNIDSNIIKNEIKSLLDKEDFIKKKYDDRDKAIILSILQSTKRSSATDDSIDHWIPKSKIKDYVDNFDILWNLQYIPSNKNFEKNNKIEENQLEFDVFKNKYDKKQKEDIQKNLRILIDYLDKNKKQDSDKEKISNIFNKIIKIREEVMKKFMDSTINDIEYLKN